MGIGGLVKRGLGTIAPGFVLVRGSTGPSPRIALTFDDGPHPENTPRILGALAACGAKATFFLQGSLAQRHAALVRAIADGGHQVANHGWSHSRASEVGSQALVREVLDTQALLEEILGRSAPRSYRPPYGSMGPASFLALARRGYRAIFWSLDSQDSFEQAPEGLIRTLQGGLVRSGEIVLFHEDYAHTVEALPRILEKLKTQGFSLVTVAEL